MVLEGGVTLATNVALFQPIKNKDINSINRILSATKKRFIKIGVLFFIIGFLFTLVYSFIVVSEVSYWIIVYIFIMSLIPPSINIGVVLKYRAFLLSEQKEYIISLFTLTTIFLGYLFTILFIKLGYGVWCIKAFTTLFAVINCVALVLYCKKQYRFIDMSVQPDDMAIKGTRDVFVSKITSALYSAFPIIVISIAFPNGAKLASVYAVYVGIFSFISNAIQSFSSAPRFAFGQLFVEDDKNKICQMFLRYEFIVFIFLTILLGTTMILILPFIKLYTDGVNDIDYYNTTIMILMGLSTFVSIIHIPSGQMINMSGNFKISKNINIIATSALLVLLSGAVLMNILINTDIYGILVAILSASFLLAIMEFFFTHKHILGLSVIETLKVLFPNFFVFIVAIVWGVYFKSVNSYFDLIKIGVLVFMSVMSITLFLNYLMNKRLLVNTIKMILKILQNRT